MNLTQTVQPNQPTLSLDLNTTDAPDLKPIRIACFTLKAVREGSIPYATQPMRSPRDAAALFVTYIGDAYREHFCLLALDQKGKAIGLNTVAIGDLASCVVNPREVFRTAITMGAASIIVAHNHPSGDPAPSPEDGQVTRRLSEAGEVLGIELLDHIIVGDEGRFTSMKEKGFM